MTATSPPTVPPDVARPDPDPQIPTTTGGADPNAPSPPIVRHESGSWLVSRANGHLVIRCETEGVARRIAAAIVEFQRKEQQ